MAAADGAPDRLRPAEAQGGPALHPRPGQLRRRRHAARHAARRGAAQPARARAHRLDRHLGRARSTRRCARSSPARTSRRQGLAWMPTLSADTQAVLATDKVRFQGQEVAFVVADDHYAARDALELIDVEYEPLPVVVDPRKALDADAPVIRDDKEGRTDNHIFDWEAGDEAETDAVFDDADVVVVTQEIPFPRVHPAPLETCGAVADIRRGRPASCALWCTTPGAARAPHAVRARGRAARAQDPGDRARHRRRLRQQGADLPRLRLRGRRLDRHRQAGEVDGGPHGEPDLDRLRPRLPDEGQDRGRPRRQASARCASTCSPTTARSTRPRSRRSTRPGSSTSSPAPTTSRPRTAR